MCKINNLISKLELAPHIEGGYYKEDYRSPHTVSDSIIGKQGKEKRNLATTCYYLLTHKDRNIFHRVKSEEIWIFLGGGTIELYEICEETKTLSKTSLGSDILNGELLKYNIKANTWFGALPKKGISFSLISCIVCPGFDFKDWERGNRDYLTSICPSAKNLIQSLT